MKKIVTESSRCTGCGSCEKVCSKAWYKAEDREKSAIRISAGDPGTQSDPGDPGNAGNAGGFAIAVCDQCGVCIDMCSAIALKKAEGGVVFLDKKSCVGCLICVGECVRDYMFYHDELPSPIKCIACGLCVKQCPSGALAVVEE